MKTQENERKSVECYKEAFWHIINLFSPAAPAMTPK